MRCAGAGSADTGGERGCTGRGHAAAAENASTLMSVTSEVSDVAEVTDVSDVKSHEFVTCAISRAMERAAPGIIQRAFHLDAALGVER